MKHLIHAPNANRWPGPAQTRAIPAGSPEAFAACLRVRRLLHGDDCDQRPVRELRTEPVPARAPDPVERACVACGVAFVTDPRGSHRCQPCRLAADAEAKRRYRARTGGKAVTV